MEWARMLAYITGTVDQELLVRNEYLATENRILRAQLKGRLLLCDAATLAVPGWIVRSKNTTWKEFIRAHLAVLAGTDFFTVEVLTPRGVVTFYVLFLIHLESRKVEVAGLTPHPNETWMKQIARNVTMD